MGSLHDSNMRQRREDIDRAARTVNVEDFIDPVHGTVDTTKWERAKFRRDQYVAQKLHLPDLYPPPTGPDPTIRHFVARHQSRTGAGCGGYYVASTWDSSIPRGHDGRCECRSVRAHAVASLQEMERGGHSVIY